LHRAVMLMFFFYFICNKLAIHRIHSLAALFQRSTYSTVG
jgi:hypothetical protein